MSASQLFDKEDCIDNDYYLSLLRPLTLDDVERKDITSNLNNVSKYVTVGHELYLKKAHVDTLIEIMGIPMHDNGRFRQSNHALSGLVDSWSSVERLPFQACLKEIVNYRGFSADRKPTRYQSIHAKLAAQYTLESDALTQKALDKITAKLQACLSVHNEKVNNTLHSVAVDLKVDDEWLDGELTAAEKQTVGDAKTQIDDIDAQIKALELQASTLRQTSYQTRRDRIEQVLKKELGTQGLLALTALADKQPSHAKRRLRLGH
jgi:hypothetical protein